ncbi:hypothetical protein JCM8547_008658 [Rhodosporidiobolus lusitaniae]
MADDLFSPAGSAAPSPTASTSTSSAAVDQPAFVPRTIKRKPAQRGKPSAAVLLASTAALVATAQGPSTSSSASIAAQAALALAKDDIKGEEKQDKLSNQERDRLEQILQAVEGGMSDWGLSMYGRGAGKLLEKVRQGNGWAHLGQIMTLQNVRALTKVMPDVQNALKSRESQIVELDSTGFKVGRKVKPDYKRLVEMDLTEWDEAIVYLENIPFNASSDHSLLSFLSSALSSPIQQLILPPLYDRDNPPSLSDEEDDGGEDAQPSQAELFAQSREAETNGDGEEKRVKRPKMPKGGGPFKGFVFAVVESKEEAERVLGEWKWEREEGGENSEVEREKEETTQAEDEATDGEDAGEKKEDAKGKGKRKASPEERARVSGMRALSYSRWVALKKEYLAYRRSLETLIEAHQSGDLDRLRHPPTRDRPPHLVKRDQREQQKQDPSSSAAQNPGSSAARAARPNKRGGSPTSPTFDTSALPSHPSSTADTYASAHPSKRPRRAPSPSQPSHELDARLRHVRTPPPALDLNAPSALSVQGAYPESCVLWVRNVHEKSTKTSLKALFGALLDQLQEGSGKGVEYVDYEKGTDVCYLRFSAPTLASLALSHLLMHPSLHLSQLSLSPVSSLSPTSASTATLEARRPLIPELLSGEQERRYWMAVPEQTRKKAREAARGRVGLVKSPKRNKDGKEIREVWMDEADFKPDVEAEGTEGNAGGKGKEEGKGKKRKRPSKV